MFLDQWWPKEKHWIILQGKNEAVAILKKMLWWKVEGAKHIVSDLWLVHLVGMRTHPKLHFLHALDWTKFTSTSNLRMWPYLETGPLKIELPVVILIWGHLGWGWALNPTVAVLTRPRQDTLAQTHRGEHNVMAGAETGDAAWPRNLKDLSAATRNWKGFPRTFRGSMVLPAPWS